VQRRTVCSGDGDKGLAMGHRHAVSGEGRPPARTEHVMRGTAAWSSTQWRDDAVAWLDERLAAAGIERTGDVEQPHLRPWATVLRAPTSTGPVWLKAAGPGTAFEVGLYELLSRVSPDHVLTPIATDRQGDGSCFRTEAAHSGSA
jgi:hypothetical protein